MRRPNEPPSAEPLAYFLTWSTYGTWLPGDKRGWIQYHKGLQLPAPLRESDAAARMTSNARRLDNRQRQVVECTIVEHCQIRGWRLHAVNCRSNHVHVVVTAAPHPHEVRRQLKAWSTRRLKEVQRARAVSTAKELRIDDWWADRGSTRYINDQDSLEAAIQCVRDAQDKPR